MAASSAAGPLIPYGEEVAPAAAELGWLTAEVPPDTGVLDPARPGSDVAVVGVPDGLADPDLAAASASSSLATTFAWADRRLAGKREIARRQVARRDSYGVWPGPGSA